MSVDYYFKRQDGALLCVTNKPYSLPVAFPDGRVEPGNVTSALLYTALAKDWPELTFHQVLCKVVRVERFLGSQTAELLSEYDVHGRPTPVATIGRSPDSDHLERSESEAVGAPDDH